MSKARVGACDAPEDLTFGAGGEARAEGSRCGSVDSAVAAAGYFMQRAERKAAAGES